nr:excalibur calcium-binding domain-containing protein [Bacillus cihuensis]
MNKDYQGGGAKSSTVKTKGGKTKYKSFVSKTLYDANSSKDRDHDGITCER